MVETHEIVTKVWIAPGCIVCDSCENDCPEVFDVQEQTCVIRPPALSPNYLDPLTPSIIVAAQGCPVDVIKFETVQAPGPAPWEGKEQTAAAPAAGVAHAGHAPAAKAAAPMGPPDPKWQALLNTSRVSPSLSAGLGTTIRKSAEVIQGEEMVKAVSHEGIDWRHAPPDQRAALLAAGGAYRPAPSMGQRLRNTAARAVEAAKSTRREFSFALVVAWGCIAASTATALAMFQDFFGPKVLKEKKTVVRAGRVSDFANPGVYDLKTDGFWIVNLAPGEPKLVALSIICTHLGCIPSWLPGEQKFKCPCHGSGYYIDGINFEGPTPRPLERFAVSKDPDGYLIVDKSKVYRQELGQWDTPASFVTL